jgi:methylated-DNA-[protein]-cysteine S-methyltransferase
MSTKVTLLYDAFESPLGTLYLVFLGKKLAGVSFKKPANIAFKKGVAPKNFKKQLEDYFQGKRNGFTQMIKLLSGTEFEKKVWLSLEHVPFGETRTYKWIAEKIGFPAATRAVGNALSKNPVPIVLPCHRIIESDGSIGGYSSGVTLKRRLLEMEYYATLNKK